MTTAAHLDVTLGYDEANRIWFVQHSDLPGLCVEAATLDEMREIIADVAPDLMETNVPASLRGQPLRLQVVMEPIRDRAA